MSIFITLLCAIAYFCFAAEARRLIEESQEPEDLSVIDQYRCGAWLTHWSEIYRTNPALRAVQFETFLANPRGYVEFFVWRSHTLREVPDFEPLPLLPRQEFVAHRLDQEAMQADKSLADRAVQYQQVTNTPTCDRKWRNHTPGAPA